MLQYSYYFRDAVFVLFNLLFLVKYFVYMEEKKKRNRPTWGMVHALESKIAEYEKELSDLSGRIVSLSDENASLRNLNIDLQEESSHYKTQLSFAQADNHSLSTDVEHYKNVLSDMEDYVSVLENRGFWSRLLNRGV